MSTDRVFRSSDFLQPADGEPIRSVMAQSPEAAVIAWFVKPGQRISAHTHPHGQDTWTVLSGRGAYQLDAGGQSRAIAAGDVAVAPKGCVHGVFNDGTEPLVFVSVVCPAESGYELL
jgi:quercetin dioxygenase-like cupin family protein